MRDREEGDEILELQIQSIWSSLSCFLNQIRCWLRSGETSIRSFYVWGFWAVQQRLVRCSNQWPKNRWIRLLETFWCGHFVESLRWAATHVDHKSSALHFEGPIFRFYDQRPSEKTSNEECVGNCISSSILSSMFYHFLGFFSLFWVGFFLKEKLRTSPSYHVSC